MTGCYWFCIVIWISTYTANLAAFLTVKNAHQPITNLEDLAESSYRLLILNSLSTYEALKQSDLETHKRIWRRIKKDDIVSTTSLAIQKVREKEDFAFINEGTIVQYAASQEPCDLTISKCTQGTKIDLKGREVEICNNRGQLSFRTISVYVSPSGQT